jgi:hypothetical protein
MYNFNSQFFIIVQTLRFGYGFSQKKHTFHQKNVCLTFIISFRYVISDFAEIGAVIHGHFKNR